MLVPPAHVTSKNVGHFPKNVGDFLKNVGLFPKNVGVFFENVGDFFCRSERFLFLLADENFSCQTDTVVHCSIFSFHSFIYPNKPRGTPVSVLKQGCPFLFFFSYPQIKSSVECAEMTDEVRLQVASYQTTVWEVPTST